MTTNLIHDHYRTLRSEYGHERIDFDLDDVSAEFLRRKFVTAQNASSVAKNSDQSTILTAGLGMTGPPHVGTIGQILTTISLQRANLDVQLALADLEAYNWTGYELDRSLRLGETYQEFVSKLGFDTDAGNLYRQSEASKVMYTGQLLAKRFHPDEDLDHPAPTAFERALQPYYDELEDDDPTTELSRNLGALFLVSDTLHPVLSEQYKNVLLVVGADVHGLTSSVQSVLDRTEASATFGSLHARLVPGLGEYPKMCKSLPESRVSAEMPAGDIRAGLRSLATETNDPDRSPFYAMMCIASTYSPEHLAELERQCMAGGEEWEASKEAYIEDFVEISETWKDVAPAEFVD